MPSDHGDYDEDVGNEPAAGLARLKVFEAAHAAALTCVQGKLVALVLIISPALLFAIPALIP